MRDHTPTGVGLIAPDVVKKVHRNRWQPFRTTETLYRGHRRTRIKGDPGRPPGRPGSPGIFGANRL